VGFFVIFVMMLKPLHIFCLLVLLGFGLAGCEERECNDITQCNEVFTVKATNEYSSDCYIVNPATYTLLSIDQDTTFYYDVDLNGEPEFMISNTTSSDGFTIAIQDITLGDAVTVAHRPGIPFWYNCFMPGDTIKLDTLWTNHYKQVLWSVHLNNYGEQEIGNWNWKGPQYEYLFFRKKVGSDYKYGWIKLKDNDQEFGPCVMQR
jgi:hypothetical protein